MRRNIIIGAVIYTIGLLIFMSYSIVKGENNYFEYRAHLEGVRKDVEGSKLVMANKNESKTSIYNSDKEASSGNSANSDSNGGNSNASGEEDNGNKHDVNTNPDSQSQVEEYSSVEFERVLMKGQSGEDVKKLQYLLKKKGYYEGEITGNMGNITAEALKKFQKSIGEAEDGILGASTSAKLLE